MLGYGTHGGRTMSARLTVILLAIFLSGCGLPSSEVLKNEFHSNRDHLDQIVRMSQQETGVERISTTFVRLTDDLSPSDDARRKRLSDSRWARYKKMFQAVGIPDGI